MTSPATIEGVPAKPILKWAGGKRRLVPQILDLLPNRIETYYEPFVGSGAVFFALANEKRFERAVLSDSNAELIDLYKVLKADVASVIAALRDYRYEKDEFYRIRELVPSQLDPAQRAARFVYLNKTGYNGLYRVNRSGRFNVPFGRYRNPRFLDPDGLRAAARALRKVRIVCRDFEIACRKAERGDAVYLDPPYVPLSRTASFTAYHSRAFGMDEQARLARVFGELASRGIAAVLSNSDTRETRKLYARHVSRRIRVSRPINSVASRRGHVGELLVCSKLR